ncbi:hypothetical protein [Bradyrhizobium sp. USDA 4451]
MFATYVPQRSGESVFNLLSQGIVKLDANKNAIPGPNFERAHQQAAMDNGPKRCVPAEPAEAELPQGPAAGAAGRRPQGLLHPEPMRQLADHQLRGVACACAAVGIRPAVRILPIPAVRRHRPDLADPRPAHHQCQRAAGRPVPAHQRRGDALRLLFGEPGASLLPDVAAAELQPLGGQPRQSVGLRRQPVRLG